MNTLLLAHGSTCYVFTDDEKGNFLRDTQMSVILASGGDAQTFRAPGKRIDEVIKRLVQDNVEVVDCR